VPHPASNPTASHARTARTAWLHGGSVQRLDRGIRRYGKSKKAITRPVVRRTLGTGATPRSPCGSSLHARRHEQDDGSQFPHRRSRMDTTPQVTSRGGLPLCPTARGASGTACWTSVPRFFRYGSPLNSPSRTARSPQLFSIPSHNDSPDIMYDLHAERSRRPRLTCLRSPNEGISD